MGQPSKGDLRGRPPPPLLHGGVGEGADISAFPEAVSGGIEEREKTKGSHVILRIVAYAFGMGFLDVSLKK